MITLRLWILAAALARAATAQDLSVRTLGPILGFENNVRANVAPEAWRGSGVTDSAATHSGSFSAKIERTASSEGTLSALTVTIPMEFTGDRLTWRGWCRSDAVSGYMAIWMRVDGDAPSLAFATMAPQNIRGTTPWRAYSISVPLTPEIKARGRTLLLGFLVSGTGSAWVDDLELLEDDRIVATGTPTAIEDDHEFDTGSKISIGELSPAQAKNLATLAKVWGFVKYHHPAVASGARHWDYDLFRAIPAVLNASDSVSAAAAISVWLDTLGPAPACSPCAVLGENDLALKPDNAWIDDQELLGPGLSARLRQIYQNRTAAPSSYYVSFTRGVGNPVFDHEPAYASVPLPDSGYQLLALFRFWNIIQYFSPNRHIAADDPGSDPRYWSRVLDESIAEFATAKTRLAYQWALYRFIARINDTHSTLLNAASARPPFGSCRLPVGVRFVEGKAVVVTLLPSAAGLIPGFELGDVIEKIDGLRVDELVAQLRPFYSASNEPTRLRNIATYLTNGECGPATVDLQRESGPATVASRRYGAGTLDISRLNDRDLPGSTFQRPAGDIAYLKLSSVRAGDSARYIADAAGTKGLIIDIRNYPAEFVVFSLGGRLVTEPVQFASFTFGHAANPGAFYWRPGDLLSPIAPRYEGKVVILIDESTQSQAEYTTMAFRTAPGAVVIGSTTAGADGNISAVPIPGGMSSNISGLGVYYPDRRPTQRIGILPDIEVKPTIAGIRAGRDELIEAAIQVIRGEGRLVIPPPAHRPGVFPHRPRGR